MPERNLTRRAGVLVGSAVAVLGSLVAAGPAGASTTAPEGQGPTVPPGLTVTRSTSSSLTLGWGASTDDDGVAGYEVYLTNTLKATKGPAATSATVAGLYYASTYSLGVRAFDEDGNRGPLAVVTTRTARLTPSVNTYVSGGRIYGSTNGCGQKVVLQKWSTTLRTWVTKKEVAASTPIRCSGTSKVAVARSKGAWRTVSSATPYVTRATSTIRRVS